MPYGTVNADVIGTSVAGSNLGAGNASLLKNRLINGDMRIDQRNAGAAFGTSINGYTVDRWVINQSVTGKLNGSQNYNSVTLPIGFSNYLGVASQSAYSVGTNDYYNISQYIEGFNIADLNWGTANAKTVTLSFQVYSSLTGTFGGSFRNSAANRSYPFTYSISVANTWTTVSVTIAGDTTGTWLTTNGVGINVNFGLGVGSTYSGTAGSWSANNYISATGATSVVGTNGATFYITGVQLEVGSSATGFEYRQYGQELALCQRYCPVYFPGTSATIGLNSAVSSTAGRLVLPFPVTTRIAPTGITISTASDFATLSTASTTVVLTGLTFSDASQYAGNLSLTVGTPTYTAGGASFVYSQNANSKIIFTGCEL